MGGAQISSDAPSRAPAPGFPSRPGLLAGDEFSRTYFGSCRVGVSALLDAIKDRRKDCEARVLDNMEGAVDRKASGSLPLALQILIKLHVVSRATSSLTL
jgi:hypothetical protein